MRIDRALAADVLCSDACMANSTLRCAEEAAEQWRAVCATTHRCLIRVCGGKRRQQIKLSAATAIKDANHFSSHFLPFIEWVR
jgi:hypothetical protein